MYTLSVLCVLGLLAAVQVTSGVSVAEQSEIVNKHNEFRRSVQPPASNMLKMSWNSEAAANAQAWADQCIMDHSPKSDRRITNLNKCGENVASSGNRISWSEVIQGWYNEAKDWRYGVGSINGKTVGHFTQVVWYNSHEIGCGMAYCPNSENLYHYVCQYCPPGNYQHTQPYKSGTPCGDCPKACSDNLCTNACPYMDTYNVCPDLKREWSCDDSDVASWCPASCQCPSDII
uniref:ShKT domain-containing protein n=1 Tax=Mola mola TaxID=94237 RepID=A0A3Q3VW71_MOLML